MASIVVGILLGLAFVASGLMVLLKLGPTPPMPPEGTPAGHFMAAFGPTGYMTFVKVLEVIGGVLLAIPRTRRMGLLILGPIVINILAFHVFLTGGRDLVSPVILGLLLLFLAWCERDAFRAFALGKA